MGAGCMAATDAPTAPQAGEPAKARIDGTVRDAKTGGPINEVRITLTTNLGFEGVYVTEVDGHYVFVVEPAESCRLQLERYGYFERSLSGSCTGSGTLNFTMNATEYTKPGPPSSQPPEDPPPPDSPNPDGPTEPTPPRPPLTPRPHVVVGVPDTGINPYHEVFYRPNLTVHPCTYIPEYPCDVPALELTLDAPSFEEAFERDGEKWEAIEPGDVFWIPQTVFVAVICEEPFEDDDPTAPRLGDICILDDSADHGTATTSSVVTENREALIAFKEGLADIQPFYDAGIPVDIFSVSWANVVPFPTPTDVFCPNFQTAPVYVLGAGNDPRSTVIDCWTGHPNSIAVGGAFAEGNGDHPLPANQPDVVSYFCRPTAKTKALDGWDTTKCGTSLAAPTVAGGLSKAVLALRRDSGYTGSLHDGFVDPVAGVTVADLREALNRTASYDPEAKYPNGPGTPRVDEAPWLQWGWGFYDGWVSEATIDDLLGIQEAAPKPPEAVLHMETVYMVRQTVYG